jgi:nucleoside-diphosphate-sugar epimerase
VNQRKSVLLTGSSGLIGQILRRGLSQSFDIYGIDVADDPEMRQVLRADVSNFQQLSDAFESLPAVEYVVHLAADHRHDADWQSALINNIHGTLNVYEASLQKESVKRIVFASSNHVTGGYEFVGGSEEPNLHLQEELPHIDVSSPLRPDGYYGISKIAGEAIARFYFDKHGIESVCLRIGSVTESPGNPTEKRHLSTWLSYSDLLDLVKKSLVAEDRFPGYGIYYGVSNNSDIFWDIENARYELGYSPQDDASDFWPEIRASG